MAPFGGYGSAWTLVDWKIDNRSGALAGDDAGRTVELSARLTY